MATLHTQTDQGAASESSALSEVRTVRKRRRTILKLLLAMVVALSGYTAFDLLAPRSSRMRSFDPTPVVLSESLRSLREPYFSQKHAKTRKGR